MNLDGDRAAYESIKKNSNDQNNLSNKNNNNYLSNQNQGYGSNKLNQNSRNNNRSSLKNLISNYIKGKELDM